MSVSAKPKGRPDAAGDPFSSNRVRYLLDAFTGKRLAEIVGASASQPRQWANDQERPDPAAAAKIIDLELILAKACLNWGLAGAVDWLSSPNVRFDGSAKPVDVLQLHGVDVVLEALDGEMWNNYA
jgi:hypothetical protein